MQSVRTVPCPRCGKPAPVGPGNTWRPFCSERCKAIDLGDWAAERFRIPVEEDKTATDPDSAEES